jgi:hypothetical protein
VRVSLVEAVIIDRDYLPQFAFTIKFFDSPQGTMPKAEARIESVPLQRFQLHKIKVTKQTTR